MPHILTEQQDGIAIVTLNRAEKRNALSPEMVVRLAEFWQAAANDDSIRVVIVTGAGTQAFCAGGDLGSLIPLMMRAREPKDEWETRFAADRKQLHSALLRHAKFFKPVQDLATMTNSIAQTAVGVDRIRAILEADTVIPEKANAHEPDCRESS